jgi:hypothetical protein
LDFGIKTKKRVRAAEDEIAAVVTLLRNDKKSRKKKSVG